jgi:hypothetical protein
MENENKSTEGVYQGVLQLVGAIFRQCAQDVKFGKEDDVIIFVSSEWFADLCDYLNVNPVDVKKRIFSSKVKQRSEYH